MASTVRTTPAEYNHGDFVWRRKLCRFLLRTIGFGLLVRIESVEGLENVPVEGPAILMMNHIAFVDPLVLVHTTPRDIVPLAKTEAYRYPIVGIFPKIWGVIPVERQGIDRQAVQQALAVLSAGEILLVAPEGTRHDALADPKEGAAYLAARSGAPIVPVALKDTRGFPTLPFTPRWREPGANVQYGRPFRVRPEFRRARGPGLRQVLDESMYVLARMLPEMRRGEYADLSRATMDTIEWL
jgi:1-acyl-sn-glycerol-3-phosphate acyltransferase